jgi:hypothetical protein
MRVALFSGFALRISYGVFSRDVVIVIANGVGAALVAVVIACKLRDRKV